jgi:hypothetical protein
LDAKLAPQGGVIASEFTPVDGDRDPVRQAARIFPFRCDLIDNDISPAIEAASPWIIYDCFCMSYQLVALFS